MISRSARHRLLLGAASAALLSCAQAPQGPPDFGTKEQPRLVSNLDADSFEAWRAHVWPGAEELAWEEIPWIPNFRDGLLAADAQGKPLLTWVMNGHPLGCT
jgi:hypothetical protein